MKNENFCIHPIKYLITSVFLILHASATTSGSLANAIYGDGEKKKCHKHLHNMILITLCKIIY